MVTNRIALETEYHFAGTIHSVRIPKVLLPAFKQLVSRGINTWDQAPQEIKDFVDELTGNTKLAMSSPLVQGCHRSHPHEDMDAECTTKSHEANAAKFLKQSNGAVIMVGGGGCPDSLKVTAVCGSGNPTQVLQRNTITCHCKPLGAVCEYPFCVTKNC